MQRDRSHNGRLQNSALRGQLMCVVRVWENR